MKLCWENLDRLYLTKNGNLRCGGHAYVYKNACKVCGKPYLSRRGKNNKGFCSKSCARTGEYNHNVIKGPSLETRARQSKTRRESGMYKGENNPSWRGGVVALDIPLYKTCALRLLGFEKVYPFTIVIGGMKYETFKVGCYNSGCANKFIPTRSQVTHILQAFDNYGGSNFYCSDLCKAECSVYKQRKRFKGQKRQDDVIRTYTDNELHIWSREVIRRGNFTCACCGGSATIGHHLLSKIEFPEFALDPNNGIALCGLCHMPIFHSGSNAPIHFIDKCRQPIIKN